ncbi:MAG: DUF1330 domain-containing protein [Pseudomonadota bacterium]
MSVFVDPSPEQLETFRALPANVPIFMLNQIRFRERANYPDGKQISGAAAYGQYATETAPLLQGVGGTVVWRGLPETTLIGPKDEVWDLVFIVRYPDAGAFLKMITSDEYRDVVKHRRAAVQDSRLIRLGDMEQ